MSIVNNIIEVFKGKSFSLKEAYEVNPEVNPESVRARIYENLGILFQKVGRGLYLTEDESVLLIEGNGKKLDCIKDNSIQLLLCDHPWDDKKSTKGGNRNFADYETFRYTKEDFIEKARVLEDGAFLVEVLPPESATNFEYLYQIKSWAKECGFEK